MQKFGKKTGNCLILAKTVVSTYSLCNLILLITENVLKKYTAFNVLYISRSISDHLGVMSKQANYGTALKLLICKVYHP